MSELGAKCKIFVTLRTASAVGFSVLPRAWTAELQEYSRLLSKPPGLTAGSFQSAESAVAPWAEKLPPHFLAALNGGKNAVSKTIAGRTKSHKKCAARRIRLLYSGGSQGGIFFAVRLVKPACFARHIFRRLIQAVRRAAYLPLTPYTG